MSNKIINIIIFHIYFTSSILCGTFKANFDSIEAFQLIVTHKVIDEEKSGIFWRYAKTLKQLLFKKNITLKELITAVEKDLEYLYKRHLYWTAPVFDFEKWPTKAALEQDILAYKDRHRMRVINQLDLLIKPIQALSADLQQF